MAVIDTNYGKTTRIPNIPETGTLLKHGTDRNENFRNKKKDFFWVGRLTANNQYFNLGLIHAVWGEYIFMASEKKKLYSFEVIC